ncbi:MAG: hypothetical protein WBD09_01010 [Halobacteriota archaeon]
MKELIRDIDQVGYSIGIHVDYKFLKSSDLNWIFSIINKGVKEVRLQQEDRNIISNKKIPKRLPIVIESISTKDCVDITILLTWIREAMDIVAYGWVTLQLYNYLKEKSKEKRWVSKRYNLNRITMKRIKRTIHQGKLKEEVEDEFELEFQSGKSRLVNYM